MDRKYFMEPHVERNLDDKWKPCLQLILLGQNFQQYLHAWIEQPCASVMEKIVPYVMAHLWWCLVPHQSFLLWSCMPTENSFSNFIRERERIICHDSVFSLYTIDFGNRLSSQKSYGEHMWKAKWKGRIM